MTECIKDIPLWDRLKKADKPIVLYGMGNGADMIIEVLDSLSIKYRDVFASDSFVRGHSFRGKKVLTYSEIKERYGEFIVLMTFAVHDAPTLQRIKEMSGECEFYAPTVPVAGKGLFTPDYIKEHNEDFDKAYNILCDEKSKSDFINILNFKISGNTDRLFRSMYEKERLYEDILHLSDDEVIVDLGAYDGDTIREFLSATDGKYKKIYAFEPDEKNFRKLTKKTEQLDRIERFNLGAWDKKETLFFAKKGARSSRTAESGIPVSFDSVDNTVKDAVTFLKMDIEGAEAKALDGARETIKKYLPKLYVCAYHRNEDMYVLPQKIKELDSRYNVYFRQHPYIPAWESNFYAVIDDNK